MKPWVHVVVGIVLISILVGGIGWIINNVSSDLALPPLDNALAQRGLEVAQDHGCIACHTLDGSTGIGPTWVGLYGKTETLTDGSTVVVDEAYIRESIVAPSARQVEGYEDLMIRYYLSQEDLDALVEFTRQLSKDS